MAGLAGTRIHYFTQVAFKTQERKESINKNYENCAESAAFTRRIGSTTYRVSVHFKDSGEQTAADKILRMIQNQDLASLTDCGIINIPQVSRQSERSA